jgi:hypothetical protein
MAFLSFEKDKGSIPVAIVKGGDYDKEVLYLHDNNETTNKKIRKPKNEISLLKYDKEFNKIGIKGHCKPMMMTKLQEAMYKGLDPSMLLENDNIKNIYSKMQTESNNEKIINLPDDSNFTLIPSTDPNKRQVWYICGQSGSGKSYIARNLAEYYKKLFPEREIYLISKLNEDETLDKMKIGKPKRINIQSILDDYPDINEFKDCMIIFDDYDTIDGKLGKVIHQLIDDLAIQGRHSNTTMVLCSHFLTNYKKTRLIINETTHFVVYPQSTSHSALKYLLGNHLGLDKDDIINLKKLGRWVCVSKNYPQYLISTHMAKILHQN